MPTITIRVTEQERAALDTAAQRDGMKLSQYVRDTLNLRERDIHSRVTTLERRMDTLNEWARELRSRSV